MRTRHDNKMTYLEVELKVQIDMLKIQLHNLEQIKRERDVYKRLANELSQQLEDSRAERLAALAA